MTVDDTHDFVIQGGLISHNCDETRYMCMVSPVAPRMIKDKEEYKPKLDPLNMVYKQEKMKVRSVYG